MRLTRRWAYHLLSPFAEDSGGGKVRIGASRDVHGL
jgi:hypothetical protein